jgi:hypothetical protein
MAEWVRAVCEDPVGAPQLGRALTGGGAPAGSALAPVVAVDAAAGGAGSFAGRAGGGSGREWEASSTRVSPALGLGGGGEGQGGSGGGTAGRVHSPAVDGLDGATGAGVSSEAPDDGMGAGAGVVAGLPSALGAAGAPSGVPSLLSSLPLELTEVAMRVIDDAFVLQLREDYVMSQVRCCGALPGWGWPAWRRPSLAVG